uniref:Furin (paired basic amino acid cleaving enzyme) a n=1 Tax=Takifugu rubripes TaxID=31033 RepID=A0A674MXZ5_TAKRU
MASGHKLRLPELLLGPLLVLLFSGLGPVVGQKLYTNTWAVHIPGGPEVADQVATKHGFINNGHVFGDYYHFRHRTVVKRSLSDQRGTQVRLEKDPKVTWAEQQVSKRRRKRDIYVEPNDPNFEDQWYLYNSNHHDLNAKAAWKSGFTGKGVVVSILDDGIEKNHPDLEQNYDPDASYDVNDGDPDPQPRYTQLNDNRHGTRCAGEVAAVANNGVCGVGVAYNAKIGGVRMLDGEVTDMVEAQSLSLNPQHIDIYSASWGPEDDGKTVDGPAKLAKEAFLRGVTEGRGGRGSIFVWASGNGGRERDNCNCDGYTNSIYTLSISSSTQNGNVPWYSEACSSTLATTYSSGNVNEKQIVTTDLKSKCTDSHTGTSASAPLAAGIIALALEANKNLTWRDMQHLVVRTSNPNHLLTNDWKTNGKALKLDHSYGYGLLDAGGIVELARTWSNVGPQRKCVVSMVFEPRNIGSRLLISKSVDACFGTDSYVTSLEHVQARLTLSYNRRGKLAIHLISPAGTRSTLLHPRFHDFSSEGFNDWAFMTTHSWDENPTGVWRLEIENVASANDYGTLTQFLLVLYGTDSLPSLLLCCVFYLSVDLFTFPFAECNSGYYLFEQSCVKECPAGFSVGHQPITYTVGNSIAPASVSACLPCPPPCLTCSSLSPQACLSCPPHSSLDPFSGTCVHLNQYMRESPGNFMAAQPNRESALQPASQLPVTIAVLSCVAIFAIFVGIFLLLQLRSGALIKLPSLEAGSGIPTVWGDDEGNTDSENDEFDAHHERTAFIKTQSAL